MIDFLTTTSPRTTSPLRTPATRPEKVARPAPRRLIATTLLAAAAIYLLPPHPAATAALEITIDEGVIETLPLAIVPFAPERTQDPAAIIAADLRGSGHFHVPEFEELLYRPVFNSPPHFADWRRLGQESLLLGTLRNTVDGSLILEFRLYDTYREVQLDGYRLTGEPGRLRELAHRASDLVFQRLTGRPGFFSTRIAYVTRENTGGKTRHRLYVADYDGADAIPVVDSSEPLLSPDWSPDGKRLAYTSLGDDGTRVHILDLDSGQDRELPPTPGLNTAPSWAPDGERLALVLSKDGNAEIYVLHLESELSQRITQHPAIDTEPFWSKDGKHILFTSDRSGGPQIYKIPVRGGTPKRLTFNGNYNAQGDLSPDEKHLVMIHGGKAGFHVALQNQSGDLRILTTSHLNSAVAFAPGGELLICAGREKGAAHLSLVSLDGRVQRRLITLQGKISDPDWGPAIHALSPRRKGSSSSTP